MAGPIETRGYLVQVAHLPYANTRSLRDDPTEMWKVVDEQRLLLGFIPNTNWCGIFPPGPNIPEKNEGDEENWGVHFMVVNKQNTTPHLERSTDELKPALKYVFSFLDYAKDNFPGLSLVGWNISNEASPEKKQSQSWKWFHFHCISYHYPLEEITTTSEALREAGYKHSPQILFNLLGNKLLENNFITLVDYKPGEPFHRFFPRGGLLFKIAKDIPIAELAGFLSAFNTGYNLAHRRFFELFVKNYEEVMQSNVPLNYKIKSLEEIEQSIAQASYLDDEQRKLLFASYKFYLTVAQNQTGRQDYQRPAYNGAIFKGEDDSYYCFLTPSLVRNHGFPMSLGIDVHRQQDSSQTHVHRMKRAQETFNNILLK